MSKLTVRNPRTPAITKRRRLALMRCGSGSSAVKILFSASAMLGLDLVSGAGAPGGVSLVGFANFLPTDRRAPVSLRRNMDKRIRRTGRGQRARAAGFVI